MLLGLLIGNLIDLDHVYYRIIGKVNWFDSACVNGLGSQCSIGFYPLHNIWVLMGLTVIAAILFFYRKKKNLELLFWISIGGIINLILDYIHLFTGVFI